MIRKFLLSLLAASVLVGVAWAGTNTVLYTSSGSTSLRTTTDASGFNLGNQTIWDSVAGQFGLQITSSNAAKVDGSAVTQPVSGTVTANQGTAGATPWLTRQTNQYPNAATALTASATGTTAATTATLAGTSGKTTYICGFSIRASATTAVTGNATVTGTISGTLNFTQWTAPSASGVGVAEMIFTPCVPASATNTGIAVVSAAPGTGGVVSSTAWGYQL